VIANNKGSGMSHSLKSRCCKLTIFLILLLVAFASIVNFVYAKCPMEIYEIRGRIVSASNIPIAGATVLAFLDDENAGYSAITSEKGEFIIKYPFLTYSGWFMGDLCGGKPEKVEIVIYQVNYYPERAYFQTEKILNKDQNYQILCPKIEIIKMNGCESSGT
jgi:hypothetical protein